MMKKDILIILFLLLACVIAWAGTNIYRNLVRSTISETTSQSILPINPTFDVKTMNKIKARERINPSFELENKITPTVSPTLTSSPSSQIEEVASEGGQISP